MTNYIPSTSSSEETTAAAGNRAGLQVEHGDIPIAQVADSRPFSDAENALLADIETRLTQEMKGLILSLSQFANRAQAIGEEIPARAQFCKLVASSLRLISLQYAAALGKDLHKPIFLDDGREYLANLGLSLNELFREVNLDGHRFMAVAFVDKKFGEVSGTADAGDK